MKRLWIRRLLAATIAVSRAIATIPVVAAPEFQGGFSSDKITRATVSITQVFTNPLGQVIKSCTGSGTLVSADGLILTNAHLVQPSDTCRSDRIVISLTINPGEPPVATYNAQIVEINTGWDLAVLRVTSTIDNRPVDRATLSLPFVQIGDSSKLKLDDTINVAGIAVSADQLSVAGQIVRGTVNGFTAESRVGDRAWIKTSVAIPGGMTGGGAYDINSNLIGIPTVEPVQNTATANCRHVQDSNGDGRVDDKDICVPVSGFINSIRPAKLARGLVLAAQLGIVPDIKPPVQPPQPTGDAPAFSRLFFAPGVDQAEMPTSVVTAMPTGTQALYLFFDYNNMRDGMIYELRTTLDGVPNPIFSLAPATWNGGTQGLWFIGSTAQTWPNGTYEFNLFINGVRSASQQIAIGSNPPPGPAFSDILFGVADTGVGGAVSLVNAGNVLPVGNSIHAEFVFDHMDASRKWSQSWYYEGRAINPNPPQQAWALGASGKFAIDASTGQGVQPGRYRLELRIDNRLAATADFVMAGGDVGQKSDIFSTPTFAIDSKGATPVPSGAKNLQRLYAIFNWRALNPATQFTWRWSIDNNVLFEVTQPWNDAADGAGFWLGLGSPQAQLPEGTYKLDLVVAGLVMGSATLKVGVGQLPPSVFAVPKGVQLEGTVTDAETGRGIAGVTFIVLKVDFDTKSFSWDMAQVYAISTTDSQGRYTLSKLLVPDAQKTYGIIVVAQGYLPATTDSLIVRDTTKSPLVMNLELNHD